MPSAGPVAPTAAAACRLRPLPFGAVRITGGHWAARQHANRTIAIPAARARLAATDDDIYPWLEAVAWEYGREPSADLLRAQREVTAAAEPGANAGRLIQAAVAQARGTGDRGLLRAAVRVADRLADAACDPEIESGLVELFRETDNRRYLDLARRLVDARPGHLAAGAADVATECDDRELLDAIAARFAATPLPPADAYAETGAMLRWAWRMLLATGEPTYADAAERLLHHGFTTGPADHVEVMCTLSSLDAYVATTDADGVQLHLYAACEVTARLGDGPIRLIVEGDDRIRVRVSQAPHREWTLSLRVPPWAADARLTVGDEPPEPARPGTYADVVRVWRPGDAVDLVLR